MVIVHKYQDNIEITKIMRAYRRNPYYVFSLLANENTFTGFLWRAAWLGSKTNIFRYI